jgi:hypothetical protein
MRQAVCRRDHITAAAPFNNKTATVTDGKHGAGINHWQPSISFSILYAVPVPTSNARAIMQAPPGTPSQAPVSSNGESSLSHSWVPETSNAWSAMRTCTVFFRGRGR